MSEDFILRLNIFFNAVVPIVVGIVQAEAKMPMSFNI